MISSPGKYFGAYAILPLQNGFANLLFVDGNTSSVQISPTNKIYSGSHIQNTSSIFFWATFKGETFTNGVVSIDENQNITLSPVGNATVGYILSANSSLLSSGNSKEFSMKFQDVMVMFSILTATVIQTVDVYSRIAM